jgi:hypothetical protein
VYGFFWIFAHPRLEFFWPGCVNLFHSSDGCLAGTGHRHRPGGLKHELVVTFFSPRRVLASVQPQKFWIVWEVSIIPEIFWDICIWRNNRQSRVRNLDTVPTVGSTTEYLRGSAITHFAHAMSNVGQVSPIWIKWNSICIKPLVPAMSANEVHLVWYQLIDEGKYSVVPMPLAHSVVTENARVLLECNRTYLV